jgi:hypothetical protein
MASTTTNNNSVPQFPSNGQKSGSTSPLASLANAKEPTVSSSNQQKTPVGTFPQQTSGGASTVYFNS